MTLEKSIADRIHHYRYALVSWGGRTPGHRPSTKLAEILSVAKGNHELRVRFWMGDKWSKVPRWVPIGSVHAAWVVCPSTPEVAAAKRYVPKLPITEGWQSIGHPESIQRRPL